MTESPQKSRLSLASNEKSEVTPPGSADCVFWVVWNPKGSLPTKCHASQIIAEVEAQRLAQASPGNQFYVLRAVSLTRMTKVETISLVGGGTA
jgi:hypothetical protein